MAKKPEKESKSDLEQKVWSAISAFEQILEAMPNDRASLDALVHAYEQVGDITKAQEYIVRLGNAIIEENDAEAGHEIIEKLRMYAKDDVKSRQLLGRMEVFLSDRKVAAAAPKTEVQPKPAKAGAVELRANFNISDELSFAWNLLEANELTQEEYASVVQDLTEMSAGESNATISVLHVLEVRGFKNLEKIIGFISKQCATPVISLASFDLQAPAVSALPLDFMLRRGAIVFESLGNDCLVVVMNPYNKQLRQEIEAALGRKCHFFISLATEFDQALAKVPQIISGKPA